MLSWNSETLFVFIHFNLLESDLLILTNNYLFQYFNFFGAEILIRNKFSSQFLINRHKIPNQLIKPLITINDFLLHLFLHRLVSELNFINFLIGDFLILFELLRHFTC